jgi:hypothetical protein
MSSAGAWYSLEMGDGKVEKFQPSKWEDKMQDQAFKQRVYDIMDEEVIQKFDQRLGNASDFYEESEE